MFDWSQPELPLFDPTEPRVLPQDRQAYFTINWLSPAGRLDRQWAFEADEIETVLRLTAGQPPLCISQSFLDRPVRRHPFVLYTTHAFVDCDVYRLPELAGIARDALVREIRTHCDDTGIPQPSAIISSGRGFYLKWYWSKPVGRDAVGGSMVGVNRALVRRLDRFGADPKATDATRLLRITGTEHTGAGRLVELLYVEQRDGRTITYDANEFTDVIAPSATAEPSVTAEASLAAEGSLDVPGPPRLNRDVQTCRVARPFTREGWHWAMWRIATHWPGCAVGRHCSGGLA